MKDLFKGYNDYLFIVLFVLSTTFCHSQTISNKNLKNTAWFCSVGDTIYDMFDINLKIGDTTIWFKKNEKIHPHESGFGNFEFLVIKTDHFANFYFYPKKEIHYFISDGSMHFVTIVGRMPQWSWKYKRGFLSLYRDGVKQLKLQLVYSGTESCAEFETPVLKWVRIE